MSSRNLVITVTKTKKTDSRFNINAFHLSSLMELDEIEKLRIPRWESCDSGPEGGHGCKKMQRILAFYTYPCAVQDAAHFNIFTSSAERILFTLGRIFLTL